MPSLPSLPLLMLLCCYVMVGETAVLNDCIDINFKNLSAPQFGLGGSTIPVAVQLVGDSLPFNLTITSAKYPLQMQLSMHSPVMDLFFRLDDFTTTTWLLMLLALTTLLVCVILFPVFCCLQLWNMYKINCMRSLLEIMRELAVFRPYSMK